MTELIRSLMQKGVLKTPRIRGAFQAIDRRDFLPESVRELSERDAPLPTFCDQTISQPYTVAFMLELLEPRTGQRILDVGSGSGWVAALLAHIVGEKGRVFGIERIPELVSFSRNNLKKYKFENASILCGDGTKGLPHEAEFDRIHVAAAAKKIPEALKTQLKIGGRMVIPTRAEDIRCIEKISKKKYDEKIYPGFVFVPLIEN